MLSEHLAALVQILVFLLISYVTLDNSLTSLSQFPQNGDTNELIQIKHLVLCLAHKRRQACTLVHCIVWEEGDFVPFYLQEGPEVQRG